MITSDRIYIRTLFAQQKKRMNTFLYPHSTAKTKAGTTDAFSRVMIPPDHPFALAREKSEKISVVPAF